MKLKKILQIFIWVLLGSLWSNSFNLAWAIENKSRVVSGYWQSDSTSYTFIAVTHSSLSGIASQVGLVVNALQSDLTAFGTAVTFTISAGATQRIFIARTNHSFLSAATIPTASFIIGTTNFKHGQIRIEPVTSNPEVSPNPSLILDSLEHRGFRDVTMLNFWGAIVIESNTTGFAMEFIGDMHDSGATTSINSSVPVSGVN
ncbi:MAG: hypothetical protein H8E32_18475 [Nitrospinae bacterium]|nr:hypothetical protein [Nitrospinota bacterium]